MTGMGEMPEGRPLTLGGWPGEGVSAGDEGRLGVVWRWRELSRPATALVLGARVFVAGLFPLAGGGGPGLLAGGRCHLQHHHTAAGGRG